MLSRGVWDELRRDGVCLVEIKGVENMGGGGGELI